MVTIIYQLLKYLIYYDELLNVLFVVLRNPEMNFVSSSCMFHIVNYSKTIFI